MKDDFVLLWAFYRWIFCEFQKGRNTGLNRCFEDSVFTGVPR